MGRTDHECSLCRKAVHPGEYVSRDVRVPLPPKQQTIFKTHRRTRVYICGDCEVRQQFALAISGLPKVLTGSVVLLSALYFLH